MYEFEITKRGTWLAGIDDERRKRDIGALLGLMASCLEDAGLSLYLLTVSQAHLKVPNEVIKKQRQADLDAEILIAKQMESDLPENLSYQERFFAHRRISERAQAEHRKRQLQSGEMSMSYKHRVMFLHAKSFIYALDTILNSLKRLKALPMVPSQVETALGDFTAAFPALVAVRDSSHHAEDRWQGKNRYSRRIELLPIMNDSFRALEGSMLINGWLSATRFGSTFGSTLEDGRYGEVALSTESLATARRIVQSVHDAFQWVD